MPIPQTVRASAAIAQQQAYRGEVPLRSLPRLQGLLASADGVLRVALQAGRSAGRERLRGTVEAELSLCCQRCEKIYSWPLRLELDVCLVHSEEEEEAVLHDADPYLVQDDQLPVCDLVEDETLLALPMLPRCESCEHAVQALPEPVGAQDIDAGETPTRNPFANLKKQLQGKQQ